MTDIASLLSHPAAPAQNPLDCADICRERRLAEQEILRQSLEEKNRRLWELGKRVEMLEDLLSRLESARSPIALPSRSAPSSLRRSFPRRWDPHE